MTLFAIGIGGSGAKCIEALTHLHACGLLQRDRVQPLTLRTFLVEPDEQSSLLARAQTAIARYQAMRTAIGNQADHFARGELIDYGAWSPLRSSSGGVSLDQVFPKAVLRTQASGLSSLFDCLFPPEEQQADLEVGFRGRPPIGSAVMSRVNLQQEAQTGQWQRMLNDIEAAAGSGEPTVIHLFGSVFGGTGAAGVPSLGALLKKWLREQGLYGVRVHASLLLPYFDFDGQGNVETGVHAEARTFQLNTDAALQYLRTSGRECFDQVYLVGSDVKVRYGFSIGGREQQNAAHLVELLAALGVRAGNAGAPEDAGYAFFLSRAESHSICWDDIPDDEAVSDALSRGARFVVAWLNNFTLEIDAAQTIPMRRFLSGAPWARRFFDPSGGSAGDQAGRPGIRASEELSVKTAIDAYTETLVQWLYQLSSSSGDGFRQELFNPDRLVRNPRYENDLHGVLRGKARPNRPEAQDTVEEIKLQMDALPDDEIRRHGVAGLADTLWTLCL